VATDCRILLEDGTALLLEDGSNLLLDDCTPVVTPPDSGCDLLLEDGSRLLQEDGTSVFLLENCADVVVVTTTGGGTFLIPRGLSVPLENDDIEVTTALLALMRRRRWRVSGRPEDQ
jgi:hypothetical protein